MSDFFELVSVDDKKNCCIFKEWIFAFITDKNINLEM